MNNRKFFACLGLYIAGLGMVASLGSYAGAKAARSDIPQVQGSGFLTVAPVTIMGEAHSIPAPVTTPVYELSEMVIEGSVKAPVKRAPRAIQAPAMGKVSSVTKVATIREHALCDVAGCEGSTSGSNDSRGVAGSVRVIEYN